MVSESLLNSSTALPLQHQKVSSSAAHDAVGAGRDRQEILVHAGAGLDGAQTVVEEIALVIIHVARIGIPAEQMPRQLEHVVGTAAFLVRRGLDEFLRQTAGIGQPVLAVGRAAGDIGAVGA